LVARQELFNNVFRKSSDFFLSGFPAIPNLTCLGEPINVVKAKYLANEKKYREAITLLKPDNSSPWDSRRDYFLSLCYDKLGRSDSAIYYGLRAYRKQPYQGKLVTALSSRLYLNGQQERAGKMLEHYFSRVRTNADAYLLAAEQYYQSGKIRKAYVTLDSGSTAFQLDTTNRQKVLLMRQLLIIYPFAELYDSAKRAMNNDQYAEALALYNRFISKKPRYAEAYGFRALCMFHLGRFQQSIDDINMAIKLGLNKRYDLINLRGINYHKLGKHEEGCQDFKFAMEHGNQQATGNYQKNCLKK
jgi:tetratricopeptide (TPR) repeat protein